jgi:hypothetical protein
MGEITKTSLEGLILNKTFAEILIIFAFILPGGFATFICAIFGQVSQKHQTALLKLGLLQLWTGPLPIF